ncbi:unnamed protein product [Hymenolepis diminuta]|nr:unnamed protein product [Hymenolepis diminuta]
MLFAARETVSRMESVISKLRSFIDDLKKLQNDWQNYNSDVDSFRKWLRQKNRSNRRVYRKSSVEEIKNEGDHLKSLQATFLKLSGNKSQSDPELSKLQTEYRRLLMQMGHGEPSRGTPRGISGAESDRNLRAEVLSELLQTVRHIKSDVDEADRRAERGYHDLHKAFHRTLRRSKSQHY